MEKKFDIKIVLICILIPACIILSNFLLSNISSDNSNTSQKELVYTLAQNSGYIGSYDLWFSENKEDVIVLRMSDTELQWIYKEDIINDSWYVLFDITSDVGISAYDTWSMLNVDKTEDEFYSNIKNSLYYLYEDYLEDNEYLGTYEEWCNDLMNGNLTIKFEFTVQFDKDGGGGTAITQTVKQDEYVSKVDNPVKKGYEFIGWYYKGELWVFTNNTVQENMTLTAKYEIVEYNISYNLNGGYNHNDNIVSYNLNSDEFVLETPYKQHYSFEGWFTDKTFSNEITSIKGDDLINYELYAAWEAVEYSINYHVPNYIYSTNLKYDITTDSISRNDILSEIHLDSTYNYELYLDAHYETLYTDGSNLIDFTINNQVTIYVKIIDRDYSSLIDNNVISIYGYEWDVISDSDNMITLMLKDETFTTPSVIVNNDIKNDIHNMHESMFTGILLFDLNNLVIMSNEDGLIKYFDFNMSNYLSSTTVGTAALTYVATDGYFRNYVKTESGSQRYDLTTNTDYNLKTVISIRI